jgi:hypothetical protein
VVSALAELLQELLGRNEERVLPQYVPKKHYGMGPEDVDDEPGAKPGQIVGADDGLCKPSRHIVAQALVFQDVVDPCEVLKHPPLIYDYTDRKRPRQVGTAEHGFEQTQPGIQVEMVTPEMNLIPATDLESTAALGRHLDTRGSQTPDVFGTQPGIDDVECPFPLLDAFFDEGRGYAGAVR